MDDPFAEWKEGPDDPRLDMHQVHVWGWDLKGGASQLSRLEGLLSDDEIARMRSFRFAGDAERFTRARAGLRKILGMYGEVAPSMVRFVYGEYGKPALAGDRSGVHFNLSHSGIWCVAAFSTDGPVGIDVEERQPVPRGTGDAIFSEHELQTLKDLPDHTFTSAFFNGWTRKEAVCKAEGLGFHLAAQSFSVSLPPGDPARIEDDGKVLSRAWQLIDLPLGGEVTGCVAMCAAAPAVRLYRLPVHCT